MLNYANLNDVEFEALCADIMECKLNIPLRRFAPGKDGGVDLTDDATKKTIVVQVKHFQRSSADSLVRALKAELPKVATLSPKEYYICCSQALSPKKVAELYEHFKTYMTSDKQIITILEIDDFLHQPENQDILQKHFKLWLDSTHILENIVNDDIFVDCEVLLSDIEEEKRFFVRTSAFDEALACLDKNRILCIVGNPGVGKSLTSKMLVLHYAAQGYRVRFTTDTSDLTSLKASLRRDTAAKEIILLDDCFGQAYFEMKYSQSSELLSLIKYIKAHPNKKLILNSRITIFQEARERQPNLVKSFEKGDYKVYILNMSLLSIEERARILYNHLSFSKVPHDHFEALKENRNYESIIRHVNFNPRIIEFVCSARQYQSVLPANFPAFIIDHLDNPREMWKDEYEQRLKVVDRILLQTIYSLSRSYVNEKIVRECFNRRILSIDAIDKTIDQFSSALLRLTDGFVTIAEHKGNRFLAMQNPSINDYLDGRMRDNLTEKQELLKSICTVQQLRMLPPSQYSKYAVNLLKTGKIHEYYFVDNKFKSAFISWCILTEQICLQEYKDTFWEFLSAPDHAYFQRLPGDLAHDRWTYKVMEQMVWDYYELEIFYSQFGSIEQLLKYKDLKDAVPYIAELDKMFDADARDSYVEQVLEWLKQAILEFCEVDISDYSSSLDVEEAIEEATYFDPDGGGIDEDEAADILCEQARTEAYDELIDLIESLPQPFRKLADTIDEDDIDITGAEDLVEDYLNDLEAGHKDCDYAKYGESDSGYSAIDAIFLR